MWGQRYIERVNIENQAVQDYMEDAEKTYMSNPDYSVSVITRYNNSNRYGSKLYWPAGKELRWTPTTRAENIREILITVSEYEDYRDPLTYHPSDNSASSYIIRNSIPGIIYYYKVEEFLKNGVMTEMASGAFRAVGQVRMIYAPNSSNIRDIGGWPTQYGMPVVYGRLYRSGSLNRITAESRHDLVNNMGVVAELDLRHEVKQDKSALGADKDYLRIPHGMYMEGLTKRYKVYVTDLNWIIDRMREGKNVDWHCAIGCDRCGTLSFLIEGLLGLSELDLCRDYELSTLSLKSNNRRQRRPLKGMISHIRNYGPEDDLARCFYNYWLHIGMERDDLDYFLSVMLNIPNIATYTRQNAAPIQSHDYEY